MGPVLKKVWYQLDKKNKKVKLKHSLFKTINFKVMKTIRNQIKYPKFLQ